MKRLILFGVLLCVIQAGDAADKPLRIYLPQDVRLETDAVRLGKVGILLGDPALIEKAGALTLGTFAVDGQTLTVDRNTVLSRLASAGIRPTQVQILGAETVRIGRYEMTVTAEQIEACARRYLEQRFSGHKAAALTMLRSPQPQVLSTDGGAAELTVTDMSEQGGGVRKVRVAILQANKTAAVEDVLFTVRFQARRVVAVEDLEPGTALTSENIRVETVSGIDPEPAGWTVPYGMVTRQRIAKGTVVAEALLQVRQRPVVIQRRQNVLVRIDNGLLQVSAPGEALDDGRVGEMIRVRRGQRPDERIIICRVQADGTVQPVL